MDSKILNFLIGILVGVCITAAVFLIYVKFSNSSIPKIIPNMPNQMAEINNFNRKDGDVFNPFNMDFGEKNNIRNGNEGDNLGEKSSKVAEEAAHSSTKNNKSK